MGSKNRIAKEILPIILKDRRADQYFVDLFTGGANLVDKVEGLRIANDINPYNIALFKKLQQGWLPPRIVTEDDYAAIKKTPEIYDPALVAYVAYAFSFGAKWFGGYARNEKGKIGDLDNVLKMSSRAFDSIERQRNLLEGVSFYNTSYSDIPLPPESILYADPPYQGTSGYKNSIDHDLFWQWCRDKSNEGHSVFISEYSAPPDFDCVWEKEVSSNLNAMVSKDKATEKLFIFNDLY